MNTAELENYMAYFYGTEYYYKTMWGFVHTDGVKGFADKAGAYWFIDEVGAFLMSHPKFRQEFFSIELVVTGSKADIIYRRDSRDVIYKKHIPFTDCPEGNWLFYYSNNVMMWNGEY